MQPFPSLETLAGGGGGAAKGHWVCRLVFPFNALCFCGGVPLDCVWCWRSVCGRIGAQGGGGVAVLWLKKEFLSHRPPLQNN